MPVSLKELHDAFQFVDMAGPDQNEAFLCLTSGKIYWRSELLGKQDPELPDDLDDEEKYIQVPGRRELDLGKPLVLAFARQFWLATTRRFAPSSATKVLTPSSKA